VRQEIVITVDLVVSSGICCHSDQQNKNPFIDPAEELKNSAKSFEKRYRRIATQHIRMLQEVTPWNSVIIFPKQDSPATCV